MRKRGCCTNLVLRPHIFQGNNYKKGAVTLGIILSLVQQPRFAEVNCVDYFNICGIRYEPADLYLRIPYLNKAWHGTINRRDRHGRNMQAVGAVPSIRNSKG